MAEKNKKITEHSSTHFKNWTLEEKRAYLLITSLLAYYHGLSPEDPSTARS